tara:strand:- start:552 stop:1565 length:1014 start_codon:yes stop_codon:yes gene_type:complete
MEKSENSIIEQVLSENQEPAFDPTSFISADAAKDLSSLEQTENVETVTDTSSVAEEETAIQATESQEEVVDEDGFSWNDVKEEVVEEVVEEKPVEEEEDWDEVPKVEPSESDWENIGTEFGVEAKTKEELVSKVKEMMSNPVKDNDVIVNLQNFLKESDADLVAADMKAAGYDEENIDDTVKRLKDSGLLVREATQIRTQLQTHIKNEKTKLRDEKSNSEKESKQAQINARKDLQSHIKDQKKFFGGKVTPVEKKELYNYIVKGDFSEEIFKSHANVAEAAFLWRNKSRIFKMMKTRGVEQGKSSILDNITSPSKNNRSDNSFETKSEGFDPKSFLS